jgi:hypothetical protein
MVVRLSASRTGRPLPPRRFLVLISVRGWVDPRAIVRLEGLRQLKNPTASSRIKPATYRPVAQCLNQLQYVAVLISSAFAASSSSPSSPIITSCPCPFSLLCPHDEGGKGRIHNVLAGWTEVHLYPFTVSVSTNHLNQYVAALVEFFTEVSLPQNVHIH